MCMGQEDRIRRVDLLALIGKVTRYVDQGSSPGFHEGGTLAARGSPSTRGYRHWPRCQENGSSIVKVLDEHVRARKDLGCVTVFPAHEVGRPSMLAEHLQDLAVPLRFTLMMSADHQAIARLCVRGWFV